MTYGVIACNHWMPKRDEECGATENLVHFAQGHKCPIHTPNALQGLPELKPGPGIPAYRPCGGCEHERGDHPGRTPFEPGGCRKCRDRHQYREVDNG